MSKSVSEFFSKKGVKKFASGLQAFTERQAGKIIAASMVLAGAFAANAHKTNDQVELNGPRHVTAYAITEKGDTICSYQAEKTDSASFARLQGLVNNATKSKTGCEILKSISKQNTLLSMGDAGANTVGFFNPEDNSICLNENFGDAMLQSCLVHEGKHSVQSFSLGNSVNASNTFYTNTLISRVMEADAVATQTKFSYELAQVGDSAAWKSMQAEHKGIADTFEAGAKKYGKDKKKTMRATMLAWYKDKPYAELYDQSLAQFHTSFAANASDTQMKNAFQNGIDTNKLIRAVCQQGGKPYATDGNLLTTPETAYLSRGIYFETKVASSVLEGKTGRKDVSASFMYPVEKDGTVSELTYVQENQVKLQKAKNSANKMPVNKLAFQKLKMGQGR